MTDVLTSEQRHRCMSHIRNKDTCPELIVRKMVHSMGFRYRLHVGDLPGKPDMVFPRMKKVIFVQGCFWHLHSCKYGNVKPSTNARFWKTKREENRVRDIRNQKKLESEGWGVLFIWECQLKNKTELKLQLLEFLGNKKK